jgi:hypothetical protein
MTFCRVDGTPLVNHSFAELNKAVEQRDSWIKWIKADVMFDPLRDDPRFNEILKRLNLAQ